MTSKTKILGATVALLLTYKVFAIKASESLKTQAINASIGTFGALTAEQKNSLNAIISAFSTYGDGDGSKLAYIIATAWHESRLKPVRECFSKTDAAARQCVLNAGRTYAKVINGNVYYGRGFVQLTWLENYIKMGNWLNINLKNNPDLALNTKTAAKILVYGMMNGSFTGKKLSNYIGNPNLPFNDFYNARRTVNGLDKATLINGYAVNLTQYNNNIA